MSDDWQRVTELFSAARALDPYARGVFLKAISERHPALGGELESLLAADAVDDDFLSPPPASLVAAALRQASEPISQGVVLKDRYIVEERLASGGQALVYRATDRLVGRAVVVKVMRAGHDQHAALRERFEDERRALARVNHPGVVCILDVGALEDGSPYLVLQFIEGVSLRHLLATEPCDTARGVRIVQAIAGALSAAHAAGVAHYDLKPENVMIQRFPDEAEAVKLIDFGLAKIDRTGLAPCLTTVMIAGSVRYMAPEQFEGRKESSSDLYALGLIACELLFGHPDLRAVRAPIDRAVKRELQAAVAFHPADRPRDIRAWADRLAAAVTASGRQRRLAAVGLAMALSLLALTGLYRALPRDGATDERIIEKVGAFDPVHEGFEVHGTMFGTVVPNPERSALIGWSVTTEEAGGSYYYRTVSRSQKRRALSRGWTLAAILQPIDGGGSVNVDFAGEGPRFDVNVLAEPEAYVVRLNTQLVPSYEGLVVRLPRSEGAYHRFELRFDPGLRTADLWIDGEKRLSGYRGHTQFQEERVGLLFGAAPINSRRGVANFLGVRFEINP